MTDIEKMLGKVQKLLALAGNNPSDEEAKAAALKAQQLIAQYNLDMSQAVGDKGFKYSLIQAVHSNNEGYRSPLATILAQNFSCKAILIGNMVNFFGRDGDVQVCAEVYNYLYKFSHGVGLKLERKAREQGLSTKGVANSYWQGFMSGIRAELGRQSEALAIIVPKDVVEGFAEKFPNCTNRTRSSMVNKGFDMGAFGKGVEDGKNSMRKRAIEK